MSGFTHFNDKGQAHMVDVSDKPDTHRIAIAQGRIQMQPETLQMISAGKHKKGDVLAIAQLAGIMASKRTSDLIPLCHPVAITHVSVELIPNTNDSSVTCQARVECRGATGVEMEALTSVQVALLTIYDMCKAVDRGMVISDIRLLEKSGGRSGLWKAE